MRSTLGKVGKRIGLVSVLALATMGVGVASASATMPIFEFTFPEAIVPSGGPLVIEESTSGTAVTCTSTGGSSEVAGWKSNPMTFRLAGCTGKISGIAVGKCTSAGLPEGEITTKSVIATVEYISKTNHEVGMIFNHGGGASTVASFSCAGGSFPATLRGEFMAKITPIKTMTTNFPLTLKGTKGTPEYTQYENEKGEKVALSPLEISWSGGAFQKASLAATGLSLLFSKSALIQA